METGNVVKAIYDFPTDLVGELPLQVGDVILVLERIDKHWLHGQCGAHKGNFPSGFVIELKVPPVEQGQQLFGAVSEFVAQQNEDLSFKRGDMILGLKAIDSNWWQGKCGSNTGIFPLTHVWSLDMSKVKVIHPPKKVCLKAQVKIDMKAQLEEEMDLHKGEIVTVTEIIDKDWYRGECNGQSGTFPAAFVIILDAEAGNRNSISEQNSYFSSHGESKHNVIPVINVNDKNDLHHDKKNNNVIINNSNQYGYDSINSGITAYGRALFTFVAENPNELSFRKGELVNLIQHVDSDWIQGEIDGKIGLFPRNFVDIIVDCPDTSGNGSNALRSSHSEEYIFPNDTYGRVLYEFKPEMEGDLSLKEGDTVTLIRQLNRNWYEAVTDDGDIGVCPSNFIEIIGSGPSPPPSYSEALHLDNYANINYRESLCNTSDSLDASLTVSSTKPYLQFSPVVSSISTSSGTNWYASHSSKPRNLEETIAENIANLNLSLTSSKNQSEPFFRHEHSSSPITSGSILLPLTASTEESFTSHPPDVRRTSNKITAVTSPDKDDFSKSFQNSIVTSSLPRSQTLGDKNSVLSPLPWDTAPDLLPASPSSLPEGYRQSQNESVTAGTKVVVTHITPPRPPPPTIIWPLTRQSSSDSSERQAPHRPAPPVPHSKHHSRIYSASQDEDTPETAEAVQQRIAERELQRKKIERCKEKLKQELRNTQGNSDGVLSEVQQQIQLCDEEINEINTDVNSLQSNILQHQQQESFEERGHQELSGMPHYVERKQEEKNRREEAKRKKMQEQRECVITELLQTEKDYLQDLRILSDTFLKNAEKGKAKGIDMETLFGNLDEVIDMAARLLKRLEKNIQGNRPECQLIGGCFVDLAEDMKQVYGHYCRNHDDVNSVLDKYDEKSPAGQFLKNGFEIMKAKTNCFDLPSMLIKPVQRILKYPLLLNELVKCTEESHPDKASLMNAISLMTDVATAINEFKRRKDLVFKYRKDADTSLSGRISKLNLHSVRKKSSRFGMKLSYTFGINTVTKDEEFEKLEHFFNALEKTIKIFIKDIGSFSDQMQDKVMTTLSMSERIADLYHERRNQQEVDKFRAVHLIVVTQCWEDFKTSTERNVTTPLRQLLQTFHGPSNLIQKRYDKLLDYEACTNRLERNKDVTKQKTLRDNQQLAKNNYEALNFQLLDEMPKLCSIATEILTDCIVSFLKAKKNFIGRTAKQILELMELPLLLGVSGNILDTFQGKHNLVADHFARLSLVPKHLFPRNSPSSKSDTLGKRHTSPRVSRLSLGNQLPGSGQQKSQSSSQRAFVKSKYPQASLYYAKESYQALELLDISLEKDDVVGVIKQQDPMGNVYRWFVDNGAVQGFVSAKYLAKVVVDSPQSPSQQTSFSNTQLIQLDSSSTPSARNIRSSNCSSQSVVCSQTAQLIPTRTIQPVRPAPTVNSLHIKRTTKNLSSIRGTTNKEQSLSSIYTNPEREVSTAYNGELSHRYEEIPDQFYDIVAEETSAKQHSCERRYSNVPLHQFDPLSPTSENSTYDNVPRETSTDGDLSSPHRYEEIPDESDFSVINSCSISHSTVTSQQITDIHKIEYYYALYKFNQMGPNQLNLSQGQVVLVHHKWDLNENPEWWFVEDRYGNQGYVPGNYLAEYHQ